MFGSSTSSLMASYTWKMSILVLGKAELFRHWNGSKTLDEPKTEKNYSTQHADAKRQMKAGHALLAETKGSKFKEEHAANCRGNHGSAVFPQEHSRERCTPGAPGTPGTPGGWWWSPSCPPIPSSPRPPRHGCSNPELAAAVSSMPPSNEDEKLYFFFKISR